MQLLKFFSPNCPPCALSAPLVAHIVGKLADRVTLINVQAEHNALAMTAYKVERLPTLIIIDDGVEVARREEGGSYIELETFITFAVGAVPA